MPFRFKIVLGVLFIGVLALGILLFSLLGFMRRSGEEDLARQAVTSAKLLASAAEAAVITTDLATLESLVSEVLENPYSAYCRVLNEDGRILAEADAPQASGRIFDAVAPIEIAGISYGRVEIGFDALALRPAETAARRRGLTLVAITMVPVALISLLLGNHLSSQLRELAEAVGRLSSGEHGLEIPVLSRGEIGKTAAAFNALSSQLRLVSARRNAIVNSALDGIITTDSGGRIEEFNPAAERIFGFRKEELAGRSLTETILPMLDDDMPGEVMAELQPGRQEDGREIRLESQGERADGKLIPVEISISTSLIEGQSSLIVLARDISQRRRSEEELRILSRAVQQSPVAVVITDLEGSIQYVNPRFEESTGYRSDEVLGCNPRLLKSERTPDAVYRDLWTTIKSGKEWHGEMVNRKKNGDLYWENLSISPIRDPAGRVTHFVAIKEDVSQRKEAELELEEAKREAERANRAKSLFLANMSHEIRTPLNAILGMGELLMDTPLNADQSSYVKVLGRSGQSLLALVNDVLDLSKIEANQLVLDERPFDLSDIVVGTVEIFSLQAAEKGLDLSHDLPADLPKQLEGDPFRLQQILINLISNAVKFTEEGSVALSVTRRGATTLFSVQDTGSGIPDAESSVLFEPFTQVDASITRRHGGTGLGLSIARRLANLMGGALKHENRPGGGSLFTLTVDLPEIHDDLAMQSSGRSAASPDRCRILEILVADDAPDNRILVDAFLKSEGHRLVSVSDGREAVDAFKKQRFDLVLMDLQMPVMDGYSATRAIRAWEVENDREPVPIVALTAHALKSEAEKTRQAGCDLHLCKPIGKDDLLRVVHQLGGRSRA